MSENKKYYQVLTEDGYGTPILQNWFESEAEAEKAKNEFIEMWADSVWWIQEGTDYITNKCRGCGSPDASEESDAYGISTGNWCHTCYNADSYPYRKDRYFDESYAGERLEEEDH